MGNRVGIITFHYTTNYGAVLQAYALKTILKKNGFSASVIDYRNEVVCQVMRLYRFRDFRNPLNYLKYCKNKVRHQQKIETFLRFIGKYLCSLDAQLDKTSIESANHHFDAFICGSDQVWNQSITNSDQTYLLDFANTDRKISYAASLGSSLYFDEHCKRIAKKLRCFKAVSIREKSAQEILAKYGVKAEVCCDPTLLLDREDWKQLSVDPKSVNTPFLFAYELENDERMRTFAETYAKNHGLEVIYLAANSNEEFAYRDGVRYLNFCDPGEFIWYLMNAVFVVTNSFHGTVFSINFSKQFRTFLLEVNKNLNNRITDLLYKFNLQDRVAASAVTEMSDIDYMTVESKIKEERRHGCDFLIRSLQ